MAQVKNPNPFGGGFDMWRKWERLQPRSPAKDRIYLGCLLPISVRNYLLKAMKGIQDLRILRLPPGFIQAAALLCFLGYSHAAFGFKMNGTLDKEAISHAYFEGEFHRVLPPLEAFRQSFPGNATREDSIFVYKYLSVIYAADSSTRTKGESYMVQLLKLMPTIELIDLYISDNIQAIFTNVKKDFLKQQRYVREHDAYGRTIPDSAHASNGMSGPEVRSAKSRKLFWWSLVGAGTAAAVGTIYLTMGDDPPKKTPFTFRPN